MTELFRLGQYVRINRNVWANQWGVEIEDKHTIDQLEAEYRAYQRQHKSTGPRPPFAAPHYQTPPVRSKGQHKTNRESRGNGRQEYWLL